MNRRAAPAFSTFPEDGATFTGLALPLSSLSSPAAAGPQGCCTEYSWSPLLSHLLFVNQHCYYSLRCSVPSSRIISITAPHRTAPHLTTPSLSPRTPSQHPFRPCWTIAHAELEETGPPSATLRNCNGAAEQKREPAVLRHSDSSQTSDLSTSDSLERWPNRQQPEPAGLRCASSQQWSCFSSHTPSRPPGHWAPSFSTSLSSATGGQHFGATAPLGFQGKIGHGHARRGSSSAKLGALFSASAAH